MLLGSHLWLASRSQLKFCNPRLLALLLSIGTVYCTPLIWTRQLRTTNKRLYTKATAIKHQKLRQSTTDLVGRRAPHSHKSKIEWVCSLITPGQSKSKAQWRLSSVFFVFAIFLPKKCDSVSGQQRVTLATVQGRYLPRACGAQRAFDARCNKGPRVLFRPNS